MKSSQVNQNIAIAANNNNKNNASTKFGFGFFIATLLYVGTGVIQPTLIDFLRFNSCLGRKWLLMPTLANTAGLALGGVRTSRQEWVAFFQTWKDRPRFRRMFLYSATAHLLSGMMLIGGLMLTGGAIYVVLYNSCPAWTALLAKYFIGRDLTRQQVLGVIMVCIGLIVNVLGSKHQLTTSSTSKNHDGTDTSNNAGTVMMGSFIVLMGCILHSGFYVLAELSLKTAASRVPTHTTDSECCIPDYKDDRSTTIDKSNSSSSSSTVSSAVWSCCLGTIEASCMVVWITVGISIWGFQQQQQQSQPTNNGDFVLDDQQSSNADVFPLEAVESCTASNFLKGFSMLLLVDGIHAGTFFLILEQVGAIGSALLKGMQTVAVVLLSAVFFCGIETAQCLSFIKVISIVLVISGTICYAIGKTHQTSSLTTSGNSFSCTLRLIRTMMEGEKEKSDYVDDTSNSRQEMEKLMHDEAEY